MQDSYYDDHRKDHQHYDRATPRFDYDYDYDGAAAASAFDRQPRLEVDDATMERLASAAACLRSTSNKFKSVSPSPVIPPARKPASDLSTNAYINKNAGVNLRLEEYNRHFHRRVRS